MANQTQDANSEYAGCTFVIINALPLFLIFCRQPWFWNILSYLLIIAVIISFIYLIVYIFHKDSTFNGSTTQRPSSQIQLPTSNNQNSANSLQANVHSQTIQWTDQSVARTSTESNHSTIIEFHLTDDHQNHNPKELLNDLIGQRDRVSGEVFRQGEKVYICFQCQLGYHEDSWQFLNKQCEQCKSSNLKNYNLPIPSFKDINSNTRSDKAKKELLNDLIGQRDRVSGEVFRQGEKVYICFQCQLGYHEDSWQFLNKQCEQCKSSNLKIHNLPITSFKDISSNTSLDKATKELLNNLIGKKDSITEKIFCQGERVYVCLQCQLGYHEDSWYFLDEKYECEQCNSSNLSIYTLPMIENAASRFATVQSDVGLTHAARIKRVDKVLSSGLNKAKQKDYMGAIEDFNEVIAISPPNYDQAYYYRSIAYYKLGNYRQAIEDCMAAIIINPQNADFYHHRGNTYYKLGNIEAAVADYQTAIRINPNHFKASTSLNIALSKF